MNTQPPASSEIRSSLRPEFEDARPPTVTITRSDGSEAAAFCSRRSPQVHSSLNLSRRGEVIVRLMSVSLTEQQVRERRKTVIRRMGWKDLRAGEQLMLCRKVMGLRLGERIVR